MKKIVIELHEDDYNRIMDYGLILEGDREIFANAIKNGRPLDDYLFPHQDKHIDEWLEGARKNGQFISEHMKGDT